jgi:hypothetical protein
VLFGVMQRRSSGTMSRIALLLTPRFTPKSAPS